MCLSLCLNEIKILKNTGWACNSFPSTCFPGKGMGEKNRHFPTSCLLPGKKKKIPKGGAFPKSGMHIQTAGQGREALSKEGSCQVTRSKAQDYVQFFRTQPLQLKTVTCKKWDPHKGGRRELTAQSWPLTSTYMPWLTPTNIHTQTTNTDREFKE